RFVRAAHDVDAEASLRAQATTVALVVGSGVLFVTFVGAQGLATVLAPGGDDARRDTLTWLLRIASPLEITWPLVWLAVSAVNARERYVLAAASAILPPIPVIALFASGSATVQLVVAAYVVGTVLQVAVLWWLEPHSRPLVERRGSM